MRMRPAEPRDVPGVYRVCLATSGAAGVEPSWVDQELLGHVYAGPYLRAPGTVAFVLVDPVGVCGYVLGATDTRAFESWLESSWWPGLREDYPRDADYAAPERGLVEYIHDPPRVPDDVVAGHPAHLHIDLLPRAQGSGWGRRLMAELFGRLRAEGADGVHLGVSPGNTNAIAFYGHLGFVELRREPGVWFLGRALG